MKTKLKRKSESGIAAIWWLIIGIAVVIPNLVIVVAYVVYWWLKTIDGTPLPLPNPKPAIEDIEERLLVPACDCGGACNAEAWR